MRVTTAISVRDLRQRLSEGQVARVVGDRVQIYEVRPAERPATAARQAEMAGMGEASLLWDELPAAVRAGWDSWAKRYKRALWRPGKFRAPTGREVYMAAVRRRRSVGLGGTIPAPTLPPPPALLGLTLEPSSDSREFRFRVEHGLAPSADLVLIVRLTPATCSPARKPQPRDARPIGRTPAASVHALPVSGGTVTFPDARFAIPPGRRFGASACILRLADGLAGPLLFADLERTG